MINKLLVHALTAIRDSAFYFRFVSSHCNVYLAIVLSCFLCITQKMCEGHRQVLKICSHEYILHRLDDGRRRFLLAAPSKRCINHLC